MAVTTSMALLGAAAIGTAGSLAAGAMQSSAADRAANIQAESTNKALAVQEAAAEQARQDNMPWMKAGKQALFQYGKELGLNFDPADFGEDFTPANNVVFQETPGYQFAVDQGERGVMNNLAALGMKNSGSALKALTRFRTGLANQEYGNHLSRLSALTGMGQAQTQQGNALTMNNAAQVGRLTQEAGTQRASGITAGANAWGNALQSGTNNISNALGMWSRLPNGGRNTLGGLGF